MAWLVSIFDIRKGERARTAGMFLYFFIIIASYWFLKPVREALTVGRLGADAIPYLKLATALLSAAVVAVYSLAITRLSRERLAFLVLGAFFWLLVFFWYFFTFHSDVRLLYHSFYLFLDLFNTVNVALFWTFLADIMESDSAKRLYGIIGGGGVIGGVVGATTCNGLIKLVAPADMVLAVAIAYGAVIPIVFLVSRQVAGHPSVADGIIARPGPSKVRDALQGARTVLASGYFLGICGLLALYELVSTVNYIAFSKGVELAILPEVGKEGLGAFYSRFFLVMNLLSVTAQLLLTSLLLRRFGITAALLALPLAIGALTAGFLAIPLFTLAGAVYMTDNALNYSVNQTAREMLFVPVSRQDKYATLAFSDIFVLRLAKALGGLLALALPVLVVIDSVASLRWYGAITVPLTALWVVVAVKLGRGFTHRSQERSGSAQEVR